MAAVPLSHQQPFDDRVSRRPTTEVGQIDGLRNSAKVARSQPIGEVEVFDHLDDYVDMGVGVKRRSPDHHRRSPDYNAPIYGELIVVGTNGSLPCQAISPKMKHKFVLKKQHKATGVSPITRNPKDLDSLSRKSTHTISMTLTKNSDHHVQEYGHDSGTDLFQIGRSADSAIDFVVVETVTEADGKKVYKGNSTVSRYACRIQCDRRPPYTARLYAAAFDTKGKIQLSAMAPTWQRLPSGEHDGLTTNGVALMRPIGTFESGVTPGEWREVTVMGNVRTLRAQRSSRVPGVPDLAETNILTDGCLIDLCGITLMWRTAIGLEQGPSNTILREHRHSLNEKAPQCPVNFLTLHFKSNSAVSTDIDAARHPWVYLSCGHVYSYHNWTATPAENNAERTCPLCRESGPYVKLDLGQERGFFIDSGTLTHALIPCGHVTTERTVEYWKSVSIPHLASDWTPRCPFCALPLDPSKPAVKLLFN